MAKDYIKLLTKNHPGVSASCDLDTSVYANITWHDPAVPEATLDSEYLELLKAERHELIFLKTNELLKTGAFVYDGKNFRLSDRAIIRWVGVGVADLKSLLSFPYTVTTMEYEQYEIPTAQAFTAFFGAGLLQAETIEAGGRALHIAINAATDEAGVDAVVDTR